MDASKLKELATRLNVRNRQLGTYSKVTEAQANVNQTINGQDVISSVSYPGIMSYTWHTSLGANSTAIGEGSAVNIAIRQYFNAIRSKLKTNNDSYQPSDLGHLILGLDDIFSQIAEIKRLLTVYDKYSKMSKYLSKALFLACGGNESDFDNIGFYSINYASALNQIIKKTVQLAFPGYGDFMVRHAQMSSSIFKDSDIERAQLYVFRKGSILQYIEAKGGLVPKSYLTVPSIQQRLKDLDDSINYLLNSSAALQMIGDIINTYGDESIVSIPEFDPSDATRDTYKQEMFVYNTESLEQIQGITIIDELDINSIGIYQNSKGFIYQGYPFNQSINLIDYGSNGTRQASVIFLDTDSISVSNMSSLNTYGTRSLAIGISAAVRLSSGAYDSKFRSYKEVLLNLMTDEDDDSRYINRLRFSATLSSNSGLTLYNKIESSTTPNKTTSVAMLKVVGSGTEIISGAYCYTIANKIEMSGSLSTDIYDIEVVQILSNNTCMTATYPGTYNPSQFGNPNSGVIYSGVNMSAYYRLWLATKFNWCHRVSLVMLVQNRQSAGSYYSDEIPSGSILPGKLVNVNVNDNVSVYTHLELTNNIDTQNYVWVDQNNIQAIFEALILESYG